MKNLNVLFIALGIGLSSCEKLVELDTPKNQLTTDKVFANSNTVNAAILNLYALLEKSINPNYNKFMGLYTDELNYPGTSAGIVEFYNSSVDPTNSWVSIIWSRWYFLIYQCNDVIEQLEQTAGVPSDLVSSVKGEAKFIRALAYYHLINTFGNVPLVVQTNVNENANLSRADINLVYGQMVTDLNYAKNNILDKYTGGLNVRAGKWAATALMAKVALDQKDWNIALLLSTSVIQTNLYSPLPSVETTFAQGSKEQIFQLWTQNGFIADATLLIPASGIPAYPISENLANSFEGIDKRKTNWMKTTLVSGKTYYFPYKYKNRVANTAAPEYLSVLRLAEQYLVRAEAKYYLNDTNGAIDDLNVVRLRAGLLPLNNSSTKAECFDALLGEWRHEFFVEWGHRFSDLKRNGKLDDTMKAYKSTWQKFSTHLPIPQSEIDFNPNLNQNTGY